MSADDPLGELATDVGPEWIGAPSIWDGSEVPGGVGSKGEGVVVGVLDTGLNPDNPSFADTVPVEDGGVATSLTMHVDVLLGKLVHR